jgi:hypothetical protein
VKVAAGQAVALLFELAEEVGSEDDTPVSGICIVTECVWGGGRILSSDVTSISTVVVMSLSMYTK